MTPTILYMIKVSGCLIVFYAAYRWIFAAEKSLNFNRIYLASALLFSVALPAWNATVYLPSFLSFQPEATVSQTYYATITYSQIPGTPAATTSVWTWQYILQVIYLAVAGLFLLRFLTNLTAIAHRIAVSERISEDRTTFVLANAPGTMPYSFLHYVFVDREAFESGAIRNEILLHEQAHSQQGHTYDILLVELMQIALWFHPVIYLFKRAIRLNHEYLADHQVLHHCELSRYQSTLLHTVMHHRASALVSNFNHSFTKKRLIMMTQLQTSKARLAARLLALLPALLLAFAISANAQTADPPAEQEDKKEMKIVEKKVIKEAGADADEVKKEVIVIKNGEELSKEEIERMKADMKEAQKEIKMKKIELSGTEEEIQQQIAELKAELEKELSGMNFNLDEIDFGEDLDIDIEEMIDGVQRRVKVVAKTSDDADGHEFEWKSEDGGLFEIEMEGDEDGHIFIHKTGGDEKGKKVIIIREDDEEIEIHEGGHGQKITIIKEGDDEEHIIRHEKHGHGENIWIEKGDGHDQKIEIIIKVEDDSKGKKKKKKK